MSEARKPAARPALITPSYAPSADPDYRDALFRESLPETLQRVALGMAWSLKPDRVGELLPLARLWLGRLAGEGKELPNLREKASAGEVVGIVQDLAVPTLVEAYGKGLFPHSHVGTPKWLSPRERCVLSFNDFHMPRRLRRLMRQGRYKVTFDRDFESVIKACAGKRAGRWRLTWITPRIMHAYADLHDAGYAHSFEVWNEAGDLVGGGYGVGVGRVFSTESQFSHEPNTSKLGFSALNWHLCYWGYVLNDGKWPTPTILDMGFRSVPREDFLRMLAADAKSGGRRGRWNAEVSLAEVADWYTERDEAMAEKVG
jgi:leucyl/phenylalanyl-tRNA--protein transferase